MKKKALGWFIVEKAGRVVDCLLAKDLCLAFQEAMEKWEPWCAKGTRIEVKPMPAAPVRVVVKATPAEVREYAPVQTPARAYGNWPYFSDAALVEND